MTAKDWKNRDYFPTFFGFFRISPMERVIHSIAIFFIGAFITSFKNMDLYYTMLEKTKHDPISNWYIVPFVLLSFWLIKPLVTPKFITNMRVIVPSKFPWKYFLIDTIWDLAIILLMDITYYTLSLIFMVYIWA